MRFPDRHPERFGPSASPLVCRVMGLFLRAPPVAGCAAAFGRLGITRHQIQSSIHPEFGKAGCPQDHGRHHLGCVGMKTPTLHRPDSECL